MNGYKHYIRTDSNNIVIMGFSDAFITPESTDILIASNAGRHYNPILTDENGMYLYKWDGTQMIQRTQDEMYPLSYWQQKQIEQLYDSYFNALEQGFSSSATGTSYTYGFAPQDMQNMGQELNMINAGLATEPIAYAIKDSTVIDHTIAQFKQVCQDGQTYKWNCVNKLRTLRSQVQTATTKADVQAIAWT